MPSDIMDQRHMSSFYRPSVPSSFFSDEIRFPSERQVGFWKTGSVPDHHCLETMSFMSGGKVVPSSPLEKFCPVGGNFADGLQLQHSYLFNTKRNISFEHRLPGTENTANCWRAPGQDLSRLYGQPALPSVEAKKVLMNEGHYENDLFSSSLSDMLNQKLRLSSNDVYVGQSAETTQINFVDNEAFESLEEIEAQTIGYLLPDDDDLLSGCLQGPGYVGQTNRADVEDDLFCSVGGLELDSDGNFASKKVPQLFGGDFSDQNWRLDHFSSSELLFDGRPTRTLFVKNINGIDDLELKVLFEQFGDIQAFYTACRHRGFILVSYFDIRAAQNAIAVLQTKSIRTRMLDIHFCLLRDNPSERDVNLGALVVTNLDSSVSNDAILQIFGVYGQIKEICDLPLEKRHKFVEFYDVRDAEAALSALNMLDIAGKRIKIETCCPGDANLGSVHQFPLNLEAEQLNGCREENYSTKLSSESSGVLHNGAMHGMLSTFGIPNQSYMQNKFYASVPHSLSSPARIPIVGSQRNQSGDGELSNSQGQRNIGFGSMPTFPEFQNGTINGLSFNSPSTKLALANVSSSIANGIDNGNNGRFGSIGRSSHSSEHKEATYDVSGNGSRVPHGRECIWSNSSSHHHPSPLAWQNMSPFVKSIPVPAQTSQMHGLDRVPSHVPNHVLPLHQHIGSAPAVDLSLFEGRHSYTGDAAAFHPASFGNIGYSSSPGHVSHDMFPHSVGMCRDPSIASAHVGISSPQQRCHMFRVRNSVNSMPLSHDAAGDRIRSRRNDSSASQAESRKQFELDIDHIIRGEDSRTTLMIKNIPNKYSSKMLLATIDEQHKGTYDFIYLPIDFKNKCNVGYAFINITDPQHIIPFYQAFNGKKWEKFNSEKVASIAYARIQGKTALIAHFQNSSLMNEDKRCRPIIFHSNGPNAGDQEPFPLGLNIRSRRSRANTESHDSGSSSEGESLI